MFITSDRGRALPLGATRIEDGINFAIFSKHATNVWLALFEAGRTEPFHEIELSAHWNRTGQVWHIFVSGLPANVEYAWRMDMRPNPDPRLHRFNPENYLLDPYAQVVTGGEEWGVRARMRRCGVVRDHFDWGSDRPLNIPLEDSVIYEVHVRGYTRHWSSGAAKPGTYLGLTEKIPYLKDLGVTAVGMLPVYEFEEADTDRRHPELGTPLLNAWGYQPISFFAPNASYATSREPGAAVREFKEMVRRFHDAGIEVMLDVVFNHTAEGDERGPVYSYRGIDNSVYYLLDDEGRYRNYSGCGNTFNCNHPVVRSLIADCLRYWVMEMHVDGFRFDLASILARGVDGQPLADPPLIERLAYDPVLANTKLVAEAWDAAGLYQVGVFPAWGRWAEWNGKFRDEVRRFVKGEEGLVPAMARRLAGSPELYRQSGRQSQHSINFITCHDGFTLWDLVSYNDKHNEANGEENRDGANDNNSWNCGAEGPTEDEQILALRRRQVRNFAALLLTAGGVPMMLAGDELARTQHGNNNAYCQDNETSWIDWRLLEKNQDLHRFFRELIRFRKQRDALRHIDWPGDANESLTGVRFHGVKLNEPDWGERSHTLAMELEWKDERIHVIVNVYWEALRFELPPLQSRRWKRVCDTSLKPPEDVGRAEVAEQQWYEAGPRSVVILEAE